MRGVDLGQTRMPRRWGAKLRPRRAWEIASSGSAGAPSPTADLKACGKESDRLGFSGDIRFAENGFSEKTAWHPCVESFGKGNGIARITGRDRRKRRRQRAGLGSPSGLPAGPCRATDQDVQPGWRSGAGQFCGSGQTLLAAKGCGRRYLGIETGREVRQDRPGAAAMTSMIDR